MTKIYRIAVIVAIAMICAATEVKAQSLYTSFSGGVSVVKKSVSPVFSIRLGFDEGLVFSEIEGTYVSMKSEKENTLQTITSGANVGLKFLSGYSGYMAVMLCAGYALQEDRYHGYCYDPCWGYGYGYGHRYHGKAYIGAGVRGNVYLGDRVSLFGEARYQSIPIEGAGRNKWGGVMQAGVSFYF